MDQETLEIWMLVNDPRYKYAVGELAAALLIATKALEEVGGKKTVVARLSKLGSVANKALEDMRTLLGDRMNCLDHLAVEFYQLQQASKAAVPKSSNSGMQR